MSTRDRILDAAADVMRTLGLARATTKEIARVAGFSEATLYKHFRDKEDLFLHVLKERLPALAPVMRRLAESAGAGTVEGNLAELALRAIEFYLQTVPMAASLFSDPRLLAGHREGLARHNAGPHHSAEGLAAYLRAERELGRVAADADVEAVARLLLGGCLQHAFWTYFTDAQEPPETAATRLAHAAARALT
ncbi:TetR/AcrR family transcriptional regulator [Bailinhaonella thermotolerans]|uniref:TetR/AcrR family transcriptional regulator n=1 Tax=Bailinhaonella thermotolerans TaxID=1070861 RepID=A0A3A4ATH2_9ACTN|nr:TetR/AcrR family transcriptional regulator [Bailinhaonella thermotolerans]RJL32683.1 TetR/AcrR family transcriptional regulator [Bailinhaonella thermotolerans]